MADAKPWTFTQLAGAKKELVLSGYDAPFGRPRQNAVVRKGIRIRQRTVRYPGSDGSPTRHEFGDEWLPWELKGRFRDAYGGKGHALARLAEVTVFVQDKQAVAIRWGDILAVEGFIEAFDPGIESEGEVEWTMHVLVDVDSSTPKKPPTKPDDSGAKLKAVIAQIQAGVPKLTSLFDLNPSFLDALDGLVSSINSAIGSVLGAANALSNLEKATFGEIARLRAGIHQLRTAVITLQNTFAAAHEDALLLRRSPLGDVDVLGTRAQRCGSDARRSHAHRRG